jgi:hypothetical protein
VRPEPFTEKHLSDTPLLGRFLALSANIRLGWNGLPGTYTLAYFKKFVNYECKKFYDIGPGAADNDIKLFTNVIYKHSK